MGHLNIVERALKHFEKVTVAVAINTSKNTIFTPEERMELLRKLLKGRKNVEIDCFQGLLVAYAKKKKCSVILRGLRTVQDYEYELQMSLANKKMAPEIESLYMMASLEHLFISGTRIREVSALGYDVSDLVPPHVWKALQAKYAQSE